MKEGGKNGVGVGMVSCQIEELAWKKAQRNSSGYWADYQAVLNGWNAEQIRWSDHIVYCPKWDTSESKKEC